MLGGWAISIGGSQRKSRHAVGRVTRSKIKHPRTSRRAIRPSHAASSLSNSERFRTHQSSFSLLPPIVVEDNLQPVRLTVPPVLASHVVVKSPPRSEVAFPMARGEQRKPSRRRMEARLGKQEAWSLELLREERLVRAVRRKSERKCLAWQNSLRPFCGNGIECGIRSRLEKLTKSRGCCRGEYCCARRGHRGQSVAVVTGTLVRWAATINRRVRSAAVGRFHSRRCGFATARSGPRSCSVGSLGSSTQLRLKVPKSGYDQLGQFQNTIIRFGRLDSAGVQSRTSGRVGRNLAVE